MAESFQGEVRVGVSIGSVTTQGPTTTKEVLLKRADAAMYEAKRSGLGYRLVPTFIVLYRWNHG